MKKITLIIFLGFIFSNVIFSTPDIGKYRIKGTIDSSFDGQRAILSVRNDNQSVIFTDTSIIEKSQFLFEGYEYLNNLSSIVIEDKYGSMTCPMLELLLESGTIYVSFSKDQSYMKGSLLNNVFMEYQDSMRYFRTEIAKIEPKWENEIVIFPNTELERLYYTQGEYTINFVKHNFMNALGKQLLIKYLDIGFIHMGLYTCNEKKELEEIFAFVDDEIRNHPRFILFMKTIKKARETPSITGSKIENFTLATPKGETKQLTDLIGKKDYVFLEFWASWCGPCLASIPKLKEVYAEYSDKLEIISISLDTEQDSWINALNTQKMPWPQLANLKGFDSEIAKKLNIKGIPFGLLLDKQGVVIAKTSSTIVLKSFIQDKSHHTK